MNPNRTLRPFHRVPVFVLALLLAVAACLLAPSEAPAAPKQHQVIISFTSGSAFGVTAPFRAVGTFDVECEFPDQPDGTYPGSNVRNFRLQIGTQVFDQNTASDANIFGVWLVGGRVQGLALNFTQTPGGAVLLMATNGTVYACTDNTCATHIYAPPGGQAIIKPVRHDIAVSFTSGSAFGVTAPYVGSGSFDVDCEFLERPNGVHAGSNIRNFRLQVGTQLFDQNTASSPVINSVLLQGGRIVALGMGFTQVPGGAVLQMDTDGSVFACHDISCGTNISAGAGGQSIIRPIDHNLEVAFTAGAAFGLVAPARAYGGFQVDEAFLALPDGTYAGTYIRNFRLQVGTQLFDQNTANFPAILSVNLQGSRVVTLSMNLHQTFGGARIQMWTDGTVVACTNSSCSTTISAPAGGQLIIRPAEHTIEIGFTGGAAFGLVAPVTVTGTFAVDRSFLSLGAGTYPGSHIRDFRLQVGTQLFDQRTAIAPGITAVQLLGGRIVGLEMNMKQSGGGAGLHMATSGTVTACTNTACGTQLAAPGGSQAISTCLDCAAPPVSAVGDDDPSPQIGILAPNVPNPFQSSTRIAFTLAREEKASLEVFDVAGRLVRTLAAGRLPAGEHVVIWDGVTASGDEARAGIYFTRLHTESTTATQRMLLLR